jgi:hypothetical protein
VELKAMKEQTIDNFLLFQTKANEDIIENFYYDEIKFSYPSNNNINKNKKNQNKQLNNKKKENIKNINDDNDIFSKNVSFIDRSSTFQAHAIKNTNYISILNKIKHKPIIIEFIFSYIRNNPLPIFILIEKDKKLKNDINSFFISTKKNNYLSNAINYNINAIQNFKLYQDILVGQDICYVNIFAEYIMENNAFPSFINFKTKYILKKIYGEDKAYSTFNNISEVYDLNNIHYKLIKNVKNIQLAYLPKIINEKKKINYDGSYIDENIIINKNSLGQEIDVLYCIIDNNEYYKYVQPIKDYIKINKIYFIFVKGNKNINIYHAIINYLNKINASTIKEIH